MDAAVLVWVLLISVPNEYQFNRIESGSATFPSSEACLRAEKRMLTNILAHNNDRTNYSKRIAVVSIGCDGAIVDPAKQRK